MNQTLCLITLGLNIKEVRKERGLSQETLATMIGVAQSTLSYIEKGAKSPTTDTLMLICNGLSISLLDLLIMDEHLSDNIEFKQKVKALQKNVTFDLEEYTNNLNVDFDKAVSQVRKKTK